MNFDINKFDRGIAESIYKGIGDLYRSVGTNVDIDGKIEANQKLSKTSSTTVTSLCKYALSSSTGKTFWFADSGEIYMENSDTFTKVGDMTEAIYGCIEFGGYIYWATASKEYRVANTSTDFDTDKSELGTFANGTTPHPHMIRGTDLYIGDGNDVVKSTDVTSSVLDLPTDMTIQILGTYGIDLMIGARINNTNTCGIFRWNCLDTSWNYEDYINEDGLNAMIINNQNNEILISAGTRGNLYTYDGYNLVKVRQIPGDYSSSAKITVHPRSMANFGDNILIGVSNSTGNPCLQGIYRSWNIPSYKCLNLDYVISQDETNSLDIGAIIVRGQDIYVAWKDDSGDSAVYGVDKVDWSNKHSGAFLETIMYRPGRNTIKNFKELRVGLESLPANCSVAVQYKADGDSSWTTIKDSPVSTAGKTLKRLQQFIEFKKIQFKLTLTTDSNNTPAIENLTCEFEATNKYE